MDFAVALTGEKSKDALYSIIKDPRYSITYPDRQVDKGDPLLESPSDLDKIESRQVEG